MFTLSVTLFPEKNRKMLSITSLLKQVSETPSVMLFVKQKGEIL